MKKQPSFIKRLWSGTIACLNIILIFISALSVVASFHRLFEMKGLEESNRAMVGELRMRQQEIVDCSQILFETSQSKTLLFSNPGYWDDNEWNATATLLNQVNNLTTDYREYSK